MSLPLVVSTSGPKGVDSGPASPFVLPTKRAREFSGGRDLCFNVRDNRRKQLRIEIPPTTLFDSTSRPSGCSGATSVKESPSSLFSVVSETNSLLDDMPLGDNRSIPQSQWTTTPLSATSPLTRSVGGVDNNNRLQEFIPALLTAPPIPGLYFTPSLLLPSEIAEAVTEFCFRTYFRNPNINQIMLFGRAPTLEDPAACANTVKNCTRPDDNTPPNLYSGPVSTRPTSDCTSTWNDNSNGNRTGLPTTLLNLLSVLSSHLKPLLPENTYALLFPPIPTQARQAIINLYNPGEGISPHVDLLKRYGDGIIGVSFGSSCVMRFDRAGKTVSDVGGPSTRRTASVSSHHHANDINHAAPSDGALVTGQRNRWDLYLPKRSVVVLTEEARYNWTHGIDKQTRDFVSHSGIAGVSLNSDGAEGEGSESGRWIERGVRLSVTFRWLLPGADVVGPSPCGVP
ncbi:hypothetical protein AX15_001679 [Amanita polypyramis BW_CC]|nr:hypothetical protein AX15_001679 [Amanita polypyramis BW_CC]